MKPFALDERAGVGYVKKHRGAAPKATYGIDAVTHQLVFSYPFPGRLALSHNGILYIQGVGPIVAINVK